MALLIIFIFGLFIGSFLNVLILRCNTGFSIVSGRSKCRDCNNNLKWYELIPVLSFLSQKGRCRKCGTKISIQYPIVEILTALIFGFAYLKITGFFEYGFFYLNSFSPAAAGLMFSRISIFPSGAKEIFFLTSAFIFFSILIVISAYDYYHKIIPNLYSFFLFVFSIVFVSIFSLFFYDLKFFLQNVLSGIGFFSFFFFFSFVSGEKWMGYGDSKLAASLGLFLGPIKTLMALMFSFWIGAIFGILVLFLTRKISLKSQVPFAPFLALGAFMAFLIEIDFIYLLLV